MHNTSIYLINAPVSSHILIPFAGLAFPFPDFVARLSAARILLRGAARRRYYQRITTADS
jgi:hypothetical protein